MGVFTTCFENTYAACPPKEIGPWPAPARYRDGDGCRSSGGRARSCQPSSLSRRQRTCRVRKRLQRRTQKAIAREEVRRKSKLGKKIGCLDSQHIAQKFLPLFSRISTPDYIGNPQRKSRHPSRGFDMNHRHSLPLPEHPSVVRACRKELGGHVSQTQRRFQKGYCIPYPLSYP